MTLTYRARLSLEATVPEEPSIEPFLKASVEFPIYCPKCGPFRNQIKKNGLDTKHSAIPQLFFCKRHKMHFYAHTSWVFSQLSEIVFEQIVSDLFEKQLDAKAVAILHQVSSSLISQIRYYFKQALDWKLAQLAQKREILQKPPQLPVPLKDAIYWDETFFRIGNSSWALILLIDALGRPLVWKFSRTRKADVYRELLQQIKSQLPDVPIFIGDGWNAYQKSCLTLHKECFLIEHLHSHPWQYVRLHHYEFKPETLEIVQNSIVIPYNSFIQNHIVEGHALQRKYKKKDPNAFSKKKGRPLGCKDKEKRHSKHHPKPPKPKRPLKKRGRKTIRTNGRAFSFHPKPVPIGWQIQWANSASPASLEPTPPISEVELLLDLTYKIMAGKCIQSNRIESFNRVIKDVTPRRGFKNPSQLSHHLNNYLRFWSHNNTFIDLKKPSKIPIKASIGFARVFTFFHPRIEGIQIRREK